MTPNDAVRLMLETIERDNEARERRLDSLKAPMRKSTEAQIATSKQLAAELRALQAQRSGGLSAQDLATCFARWKMAAMKALTESYSAEQHEFLGSRTKLGEVYTYVVIGSGLERLLKQDLPESLRKPVAS